MSRRHRSSRFRFIRSRRATFAASLGLLAVGAAPVARADYADLVSFFSTLAGGADAAVFPVSERTRDDIESAFGPRQQVSTDQYDWHRGIDIDGALNTDTVVAPLKGYFYDYRYTASGGNIVILEHHFADFNGGAVSSISYGGKTLTKFYTWHMHLYDDGVADNGVGTADLVAGYTKTVGSTPGTAITRSTQIGVLGDSGGSGGEAYAPHLHWELRVGTNSSLEFQLANPGTTQWGFDPHVNPLLLFAPGEPAVAQTLTLAAGAFAPGGGDLAINYGVGDDDAPVFNRVEVRILNADTLALVDAHVLDLNQRIGYDASSTATLDDQGAGDGVPYLDPLTSAFGANDWKTRLIVPESWFAAYADGGHKLLVLATDIWGNETQLELAPIPEPAAFATLTGGALLLASALRRRRREPRSRP